ncbi:Asp23/Gls24 family envelope stress response protein [Saccharomonospora cyanea]|uniref:Asp23/Gls24 family envelope stress response protein n=1 Tax=Saccharomonospora cyanea NA-134 TaxID=882082 RepID=H5XEH1_9PSEU|nr:Asp23/Gls24 family envelope stress response protein [Saccharomonospora cyanea]EHR61439.1 Protein of unknown function (DUF322) [Saccharomonospora cyanea NA-134]
MTAPRGPGLVDGVDVDRVADTTRACPGVLGLEGGVARPAQAPAVSYLPGRTVPGVRVESDRVTVQVIGEWGVPIPELGRRIQAAVAPHVAGRRVDVIVARLAGAPTERADFEFEL